MDRTGSGQDLGQQHIVYFTVNSANLRCFNARYCKYIDFIIFQNTAKSFLLVNYWKNSICHTSNSIRSQEGASGMFPRIFLVRRLFRVWSGTARRKYVRGYEISELFSNTFREGEASEYLPRYFWGAFEMFPGFFLVSPGPNAETGKKLFPMKFLAEC